MSDNNRKTDNLCGKEWQSQVTDHHFEQADMNQLVMNYFATGGFEQAADTFESEAGVEPTVELNTLKKRLLIRGAVQNKRVGEAIELVSQLLPELSKTDNFLHFRLLELHRIDLIRDGKNEEASAVAQSQMSEASESYPELMRELEKSLASLAIDQPQTSSSSDLLEQSYRQKVASQLDSAILKTEEETPQITKLLKLIFWAEAELQNKGIPHPKLSDYS